MAYATHQARLSITRPDGTCERDHLMSVIARGESYHGYDAALKRLEGGVSLPDSLAYVFGWFLELRAVQRSNMNGLEPISYSDIGDWAVLTDRSPSPWEIDLLTALDRTVRNEMAPKKEVPTVEVDVPRKRR